MNLADRARAPVYRPERKGPGRVLVDLLAPGTGFRGFFEFALIGAIVLAFLHGVDVDFSGLLRAMAPGQDPRPAVREEIVPLQPSARLPVFSGARGDRAAAAPAVRDHAAGPPPVPVTPHLAQLDLRADYFSGVAEPLRTALVEAQDAYERRDLQRVLDVLADADPDGKVLLLRGLALIGRATAPDVSDGVALLQRAIALGEPKAMAMLGVLKFVGFVGLPQDIAGGRRLLEQAAAAGDAAAARVVAIGYGNGWTGAVDLQRAATFMRIAADRHDVKATYLLAKMLAEGSGVAKDTAESERLMLAAAQAGDADAEFAVGLAALRVYSAGATSDPEPALSWLDRAAAQGLADAHYTLGLFYLLSKPETGYADPQRGVEHLRQCAEVSFTADCAFAYANAFELGSAGVRDPLKAYAFFLLAEEATPSDGAKRRLKDLTALMSPQQIAQAQAYSVEVRQRIAAAARSRAGR